MLSKRLAFTLVLGALAVLMSQPANAAEQGKGLGDGNDGNRSGPIHLITIYDDRGLPIKASDSQPRPISFRKTCGECHDYDFIAQGWHFHSGTTNAPAGRRGEPWVLADSTARTQIPISNRDWPGAHKPKDLGISPWRFLKLFSSHFPGGNYGEMEPDEDDEEADPLEFLRWPISGKYEINCLACHNADRRQDQSEAALQAARENYQWAGTAASGLATVSGTAFELDDFYDPETDYKIVTAYAPEAFDSDNKVFFDLVREPPSSRCYFCHSTQEMATTETLEWTRHEDIHLTAGMSCVDCHRNGDDHMIARGDVEESNGDPTVPSSLSCRGCHMGDETSDDPSVKLGGHLSAPYPHHEGIPPIHFEELSCTSCHSGALPTADAGIVRTARTHKLGLHGKHQVNLRLPHLWSPVFVRGESGKIEPHNLFWPSFWGVINEGDVTPINPGFVTEIAGDELGAGDEDAERINDWKPLSQDQIKTVLQLIDTKRDDSFEYTIPDGKPVFVAGGELYQIDDESLISGKHEAAEAYSWPIGHDVRPATQSLGAEGRCTDCHDPEAPFLFGTVAVDSPVRSGDGLVVASKEMVELEEVDREYNMAFARSFLFRPMMKGIVIFACTLLGLVLLAYFLKGIGWLTFAAAEKEESK